MAAKTILITLMVISKNPRNQKRLKNKNKDALEHGRKNEKPSTRTFLYFQD